jgi:hypothetical protein
MGEDLLTSNCETHAEIAAGPHEIHRQAAHSLPLIRSRFETPACGIAWPNCAIAANFKPRSNAELNQTHV